MKALRQQQGMTLIMALILLIMLTLLALTSFNLGKSTLMVVSNMQQHEEASAAAQQMIEEVVSSNQFTEAPATAINSPCNGVANTRCVDSNGDGTTDVKVVLTPAPTCIKAKPIKSSEIDPTNEDVANCLLGSTGNTGVEGAFTGNSMCSSTVWEVTAVATDQLTDAQVTVVQGVSTVVDTNKVLTQCP